MNLERTKKQLTRHEGLRLAVYDDATGKPLEQGDTIVGHPTVGVGRLAYKCAWHQHHRSRDVSR